VSGGLGQRNLARATLKELVLDLRRIEIAAAAENFDEAKSIYEAYRAQLDAAATLLHAAEAWSLFNPVIHDRHYGAMKQIIETAHQATR